MKKFLTDYFDEYNKILSDNSVFDLMVKSKQLLTKTSQNGNTIFIQGNGASAAIASHCALDFTKQAKLKTMSFNESSLITAYANDYGYADWLKRAFESYASEGDTAILISSSGKSENVVKAAEYIKTRRGMQLITFTGFKKNNPLKELGDINFWVNSKAYNIIECVHMIWLTAIIDLVIGKAEYSVN